jgi:hypothetical protein
MELWIICLSLAIICLLVGLALSRRRRLGPPGGDASLSVVASIVPSPEPEVPNMFDRRRIQQDLASLAGNRTLLNQYLDAVSRKFRRSNEIALIKQWTEFYKAGRDMVQAQTEFTKAGNDHQQLAQQLQRENTEKNAEQVANIAKHEADAEEHRARAAKARAERKRHESDPQTEPPQTQQTSPADRERFDRYQSKRYMDRQQYILEKIQQPVATRVEAEKAYKELKRQIYRDGSLTAAEQDQMLEWLEEQYRTVLKDIRGNKGSIYEHD